MSELADALANLNEDEVAKLIHKKIDAGVDAMSILDECRMGMDIVGQRYKKGDYFLSELIVSGEIFKESMKVIEPHLGMGRQRDTLTKIVLGTVKGDIHNIGKDIVCVLLKGAGFEVYDLGIDVAPAAFVDKLKETGAPILGMSGLLTPSFESMLVKKHTNADAFTDDGLEGVDICKEFIQEMR